MDTNDYTEISEILDNGIRPAAICCGNERICR